MRKFPDHLIVSHIVIKVEKVDKNDLNRFDAKSFGEQNFSQVDSKYAQCQILLVHSIIKQLISDTLRGDATGGLIYLKKIEVLCVSFMQDAINEH